MKLSTRLTLAFALLALLPTGLLGWITLDRVSESFESMFTSQLGEAERTVAAEVERTGADVRATVEALATTSDAVARTARALYFGEADLAELVSLAERLMVGLDLDALFLLDAQGRVLSSAHLPARFGYPEPELASLAQSEPGRPMLRRIEIREGDRIEKALVLLVGTPVVFGRGERPAALVGGRRLDEAWVSRLAELTGAAVTLRDGGELVAHCRTESPPGAGSGVQCTADAGTPGTKAEGGDEGAVRTRIVSLEGGEIPAELEVAVSGAPLIEARQRILTLMAGTGAGGLLFAFLLGGLIAGRITRPVDALAGAAGRVAGGDYDTRVDVPTSGELARLVDAFNTMTGEIQRSRDRIAAAERVAAWQEIARRLAHEIKNPLTPISMSIETLQRTFAKQHPQFDEIFAESTGAILEEVEALKKLVSEFSGFARLPAPSLNPTPVGEIVEGTMRLFPEPPGGIELERDVPPDLPPILADREQLQQVLLNLVTNSVQAIQAAGGTGRVRVAAAATGGTVVLEVEDDGPGIPEDHLAELFTPYFTTKEEGTGLGLAICHRIVLEHGGRIEVDTTEGKGTTVRLHLQPA